MLQEQWAEFERWFSLADVRAQFSRIIADGGGEPIQVSSIPSANAAAAYLPSLQQHGSQSHLPPATTPHMPIAIGSLSPPDSCLSPSPTSRPWRARARAGTEGYPPPHPHLITLSHSTASPRQASTRSSSPRPSSP